MGKKMQELRYFLPATRLFTANVLNISEGTAFKTASRIYAQQLICNSNTNA